MVIAPCYSKNSLRWVNCLTKFGEHEEACVCFDNLANPIHH